MDPFDALSEHLGYSGRMLSGSKSAYDQRHPEHLVYFNACAFVDQVQVWHGDVDFDIDSEAIQKAADACGQTIHITPEHPFRFGGWKGGDGAFERMDSSDRDRIRTFEPKR